jgi:hypothetical protein
MKEEFNKQRENAYAMERCDDLHQEHLAECSFCRLEIERETILKCAEWIKENLNLGPGTLADLMIKDLLYYEDKGETL